MKALFYSILFLLSSCSLIIENSNASPTPDHKKKYYYTSNDQKTIIGKIVGFKNYLTLESKNGYYFDFDKDNKNDNLTVNHFDIGMIIQDKNTKKFYFAINIKSNILPIYYKSKVKWYTETLIDNKISSFESVNKEPLKFDTVISPKDKNYIIYSPNSHNSESYISSFSSANELISSSREKVGIPENFENPFFIIEKE